MADDLPPAVGRASGGASRGALLRPNGIVLGPSSDQAASDGVAASEGAEPGPYPGPLAPSLVTVAVLTGPAAGAELTFAERAWWLAGRAAECRLRLPRTDTRADRFHCLFDVSPPHVRVRDLGTAHGTFVNGERIGAGTDGTPLPEPARWAPAERDLADGDEVRLGTTLLRVAIQAPDTGPAAGTAVAPAPAPASAPAADTVPAAAAPPRAGAVIAPVPASGAVVTAAPVPAPGPLPASGAGAGSGPCVHCPPDSDLPPDPLPDARACERCRERAPALLRELLARASGDGGLAELRGYQVLRELGRGRHGVVCLARHRDTGTRVALKLLLAGPTVTPRARAAFLARLERLRGLRHPGILSLYGSGAHGSAFCVAVEYAAGGTLEELLSARGGTLPPGEAVGIAVQVLDALASAHATPPWWDTGATGHAHLDVRPSNILLTGTAGPLGAGEGPAAPAVKLADFGLAAAFDRAGLAGLTRTGPPAEPVGYLPRVRLVDDVGAGPECDVWATAAVLYRLLTGAAPREVPPGADPLAVLLRDPPIPLRRRNPAVPRRLAQVIDAALIDSPRIVTARAGEFREALSASVG
ncbi:protein kinase [Streptomyces sp. TS71-3]|uniref:protein kinase domain-containing protein n=1 Tax=Streptomyces sp. TS71-3 TaxID=2733862 RepID=UPI001B262696|nr:protein kinase [Streptomyces sp. TS71-3]GHJ42496.1 hypothetical protein Sm713_81050 [Streptomyces sp. TS71-3]